MIRNPLTQILLFIIALILYATIYPFQFESIPHELLAWTPIDSRTNFLDLILNLLFFIPLGLVAGCKWRSRSSMLWVLIASCALSTSVELLQAFIPGRYSSLKDIFINTMGSFLGLPLAHLPIFDTPVLRQKHNPLLEDRGRRIMMLLMLAYLYFPFLPQLRMIRIRLIVESWNRFDLAQFAVVEQAAIGFFVASLWSSPNGWKVQLFLLVAAPAQLLLINRFPQVDQVAGLTIGYAAGLALTLARLRVPATVLAAAATLLMAYKELRPFEWSGEKLNNFTWIPFEVIFSIGRAEGFRITCLKSFVYRFTIRQVCKVTGWSAPKVASVAAILVLLSEFAQQYIPGRTPETTDALICLMGASLFLELGKFDDQGL